MFLVGGVVGWFLSPLINRLLAEFFRGFNWFFARLINAYGRAVGMVLRLSVIVPGAGHYSLIDPEHPGVTKRLPRQKV